MRVFFNYCGDGATASRVGFDSRNHIESADEMVRRGRGNFRATAKKLFVTSPAIIFLGAKDGAIPKLWLCKEANRGRERPIFLDGIPS